MYQVLLSAYSGPDDQEGMRKTDFRPESNPGLMTSKPAHQTLSHDHGTITDGSLSFSFPLDHLGLSMLTTKLNTSLPGH